MKKRKILFGTAVLFTVLALCGCAGKETSPIELDSSYTFTAEISQNSENYAAVVSRNGESGWTISFTQPETLAGVELELANDTAVLSYDGLRTNLTRSNLPLSSVAGMLTGTLDHTALSSDVKFYSGSKGTTKAYGTWNGADYALEFNKSDQPTDLTIEGEDFEATITDFESN